MRRERVVEAIRRYVLNPGNEVMERHDRSDSTRSTRPGEQAQRLRRLFDELPDQQAKGDFLDRFAER
ncbi:hypothetical protein [Protofrankia symbiont of Coriaria ruscifolia]|uniref:hypothetical protein n=1 Tax=Protofrankia symbiont of Coriaria ruscifolia TaxID=1306542 RepID=UPI00104124F9|nr:hypothetical protein [Protofrankia symbiont of Coriaria ruscifolia]